jgi:Sulfotransferase family
MVAQIDSFYIKTRPTKTFSRLLSYALFEGRPVTTKGQWINPLVLSLLSVEKRLPQLKKVEKPIFIIGTGRSGTTILGVVLSMHRDVGFLNEPKALWHKIYSQEDLVGSYSRGVAHYRLEATDVTPEISQAAHRLFGAYLTAVVSRRVVDKYPEQVFRLPFVRQIFPDAKFIFLVRNGWDTCKSIEQWSQRLGTQVKDETHDWWGVNDRKWHLLVDLLVAKDPELGQFTDEIKNFTDHSDRSTVEWILTMKEGLHWLKELPDSVYRVNYEDLVTNSQVILKELLDFCELPQDTKMFDYAEQTLNPVTAKQAFPLNPLIVPAFNSMMNALGY